MSCFPNIYNYCFSIDAREDTGRLGRFINHSIQKNNIRPKVKVIDGLPRLLFFAMRDIAPGEELRYNYNDNRRRITKNYQWMKD